MPFKPPFKDTYSPGDLFYGLGGPRKKLLEKFDAIGFAGLSNLAWIDVYKMQGQMRGDNADFVNTLRGHDKYKTAVGGKEVNNSFGWRRKSKGGLYWATMVASKPVHFCLDGLDMMAVVTRSYVGPNPDSPQGPSPEGMASDQKSRSITGAELRWVYRNKLMPQVRNLIQFWQDGSPCLPPWEQSMELYILWKTYQPRNAITDTELD